ncbi:MAG: hypothetical protein ACXAC6_03155 [Candidatus Hodarchaeales archaeon]|jgi:hypothetical protein
MTTSIDPSTIDWLLSGDPSIKWQVMKDLCSASSNEFEKERSKIELEGWGKKFLSYQDPEGTWAQGFYSPKWISTTYTLLLLRRLGINPLNENCRTGSEILLNNGLHEDGGINYTKSKKKASETCITGLVLGILSYFQIKDDKLDQIISYIISNQMTDGGWNCRYIRGATHGSFHTTLMVLEALHEYKQNYSTSVSEISIMQEKAHEFLLSHRLYKSHRTGNIVDSNMTLLTFPQRWKYRVLSALDYFQAVNHPYDERFSDAVELILKKEKNGKWPLQQAIPGKLFFKLEEARKPSRWNTLRALRVLQWWRQSLHL